MASCTIHNLPISHYCETCDDVICELCYTQQGHCGSTHQILTLKQSADLRKSQYASYLSTEINPHRVQVNQRVSELEAIKKHYQQEFNTIHKDLKIEFECIKSRLEKKNSTQIDTAHTEIKHLEMYVNLLDDVVETYEQISEDPQTFLISYANLDRQICKLEANGTDIAKQGDSKEAMGELPREILKIQQKVDRLQQYRDRNKFMNQMLNNFIAHCAQKLKTEKANSVQKAKKIKQTYNTMFEKMVSHQNAKICIFCGSPFSIDSLNSQCSNNRKFKLSTVYPVNEQIIPDKIRGSLNHFWMVSESAYRARPQLESHSIIRQKTKKHYLNSLNELGCVKFSIANYEIEHGKSLEQVFETNDPKHTGFVSKVAFEYVMIKIYKLPAVQTDSLANLLQEEHGINYNKLTEVLENPQQDYDKFEQQQQEAEKSKPVAPRSINRYVY